MSNYENVYCMKKGKRPFYVLITRNAVSHFYTMHKKARMNNMLFLASLKKKEILLFFKFLILFYFEVIRIYSLFITCV